MPTGSHILFRRMMRLSGLEILNTNLLRLAILITSIINIFFSLDCTLRVSLSLHTKTIGIDEFISNLCKVELVKRG